MPAKLADTQQKADWLPIDQNTDQWLQLRAGRIGGSSIACIMANYGKAFGNPAKNLAVKLAIEQLTGIAQESGYSNDHMSRGHEQEPIARALYEDERFCDVTNGGYYTLGDDIGVSPDGLVGDDGIIEIKSVLPHIHFETVKRDGVDPAYKWQVAFNLKVSGREWIDFVSFSAGFPEGKRLFTFRVYRKFHEQTFDAIDTRLTQFRKLISDAKDTINGL